jgi:hypothetical protein
VILATDKVYRLRTGIAHLKYNMKKRSQTASRKAAKGKQAPALDHVLNIPMPPSVKAKFVRLAKRRGTTMSAIAREALEMFVARNSMTDEQKGWAALELLDTPDRKKVQAFIRRLGIPPQSLVREAMAPSLEHCNDEGDPDFIRNLLIEAGKL